MGEASEEDVAALRAFNRTYTARFGFLNSRLDGSLFSLSEARIIFEIRNGGEPTAADIARSLNIDRAQLSRTLKRFAARGLVVSRGDPHHGRNRHLSLTAEGEAAAAALDRGSELAISRLLAAMAAPRRKRIVAAAAAMNEMLVADAAPTLTLRSLQPGDLGLIISRQARLYWEEYGWNADYEALVARILADFQDGFDPDCDAAWIAEIDGAIAGSIFLVSGDQPQVGKLRLLYVEPDARGAGIGKWLVSVCIERARQIGYCRLELWTNSVLIAARKIYEQAGFQLVHEEEHCSFGKELTGQTWALVLTPDGIDAGTCRAGGERGFINRDP